MGIEEKKKKKTKMECDRVLNLSLGEGNSEKNGMCKKREREIEGNIGLMKDSTSENTPPASRTNCEQRSSHLSMAQTPRAS